MLVNRDSASNRVQRPKEGGKDVNALMWRDRRVNRVRLPMEEGRLQSLLLLSESHSREVAEPIWVSEKGRGEEGA